MQPTSNDSYAMSLIGFEKLILFDLKEAKGNHEARLTELERWRMSQEKPRRQPLSVRDWMQIGFGILVLGLAIAKKVPWSEALPFIGKIGG